MGEYAEPMSMSNLAGIVLVCIGFLAYSGYGFAQSFLVAQVLICIVYSVLYISYCSCSYVSIYI